jgi:hypothetical protein
VIVKPDGVTKLAERVRPVRRAEAPEIACTGKRVFHVQVRRGIFYAKVSEGVKGIGAHVPPMAERVEN